MSPDMSPSRRCVVDRLGARSKVLGAASCAPVTTLADSPLIVSAGMGRGGQLLHNLLHTTLTATAGSEKLTTQTEHIPALYRC